MADRVGVKLFLGAAVILASGLVFVGLSLIRSPSEVRAAKEDDRRVQHVQTLRHRVEGYYRRWGELPKTLAALSETNPTPTDPISGDPYGYDVVDMLTYRLCAVFNRSVMDQNPQHKMATNVDWRHEAGDYCFTFTVPARNAD